MKTHTVSHPNIALVKYWGKDSIEEITPLHGSLSVTLDFGTTTTEVEHSESNQFILNGFNEEITDRLQSAISFFNDGNRKSFKIVSDNSFPTAAGLASSASGAAAFVFGLASIVGETESPLEYWNERNVDLTTIVRKVSGSGCRSVFGGFVEWIPGSPQESIAKQICSESYWKDFKVFSVVLSSKKKSVLSTPGMQKSVETVPWIRWRAAEVVPHRIFEAKQFIMNKDFGSLSDIIMKDSNELHAACLATYPPIKYLNDNSFQVIEAIHSLNKSMGKNIAAYSFDAGPNPFVFTTSLYSDHVRNCLLSLDCVDESNISLASPTQGVQSRIL